MNCKQNELKVEVNSYENQVKGNSYEALTMNVGNNPDSADATPKGASLFTWGRWIWTRVGSNKISFFVENTKYKNQFTLDVIENLRYLTSLSSQDDGLQSQQIPPDILFNSYFIDSNWNIQVPTTQGSPVFTIDLSNKNIMKVINHCGIHSNFQLNK